MTYLYLNSWNCSKIAYMNVDAYRLLEQAGIRRNYRSTDGVLIEKFDEYHIDICLCFVNFQKSFDSVEHWSVFNALSNAINDN